MIWKNDKILRVKAICQIFMYVGRSEAMRVHITLECTECHEQNYLSSKNRRNNPDRVELKKYCPRDHKVTLHKETK